MRDGDVAIELRECACHSALAVKVDPDGRVMLPSRGRRTFAEARRT
jgi:hypothetical protein